MKNTSKSKAEVKSSDDWISGGSIRKRTFDKAVQVGQNLQRFNPYGSELHRKGFEIVRQACIRFFGQDKLGNYESF